jgi:hypothetical protein
VGGVSNAVNALVAVCERRTCSRPERVRVTDDGRPARAAMLLAMRLEELAAAAERASRAGEALLLHRIELAHASTQHAIELGLMTQSEALAIWRRAKHEHPALADLERLVLEEAAPALPAETTLREHLA